MKKSKRIKREHTKIKKRKEIRDGFLHRWKFNQICHVTINISKIKILNKKIV